MLENLRATSFNDGTPIPNITENIEWDALTTPGYCWYENNMDNKDVHGALYNWYAVNTGKLCPEGWHVPTDTEWNKLFAYLWDNQNKATKLAEKGYFKGPILARYINGSFSPTDFNGLIWSASKESDSTANAWEWNLDFSKNRLGHYSNKVAPKQFGLYVRCVKD
jgi:uncharacterized protein (TIGR02145 family)